MFGKQLINVVQFWKASKIVSLRRSRNQRHADFVSWLVLISPNDKPREKVLLEHDDKVDKQD
jgi:hypothetical protein